MGVNMTADINSAAALSGRSRTLGGWPSKNMCTTLGSPTGVILVGAATRRTESYGSACPADITPDWCRKWELEPAASVAMTASDCRPHGSSPIPTEGELGRAAIDQRPAIAAGRGRSAAVAEVGVSGDDGVDLVPAMRSPGELGHDPVFARSAPGSPHYSREPGCLEGCVTFSKSAVISTCVTEDADGKRARRPIDSR